MRDSKIRLRNSASLELRLSSTVINFLSTIDRRAEIIARNRLGISSDYSQPQKDTEVPAQESSAIEDIAADDSTASQIVSEERPTLSRPANISPRDICHTLYHHLQDSGITITSDLSLGFGDVEHISIESNGSISHKRWKEGYSPQLLFTFLVSLANGGSMLYTGDPGTGKTSFAELVTSHLFGIPHEEVRKAVIYGNPELTTNDMIATLDLAELMKGREVVNPRMFLSSRVRIIDEINRIPAGKRAALYQITDAGFASVLNQYLKAADGPLFATANPPDAGNCELEYPLIDRFDINVKTRSYNSFELDEIVSKAESSRPNCSLAAEDIYRIRDEVNAVQFRQDVMAKLIFFIEELNFCDRGGINLERKTKSDASNLRPGQLCKNPDCRYSDDSYICNKSERGLSPRTYKAALLYPRLMAWWRNKTEVELEDFNAVMPYVISHKLVPTETALEDAAYINDRIALASKLLEQSSQSYEMELSKFPELPELISLISMAKYNKNNSGARILELEKKAKEYCLKTDSCIKVPLMVALYSAIGKIK